MKIPELKEMIKNMDEELVKKIFVEVYKQFPKRKKEEDIDPIIQLMIQTKGEKIAKKEEVLEFDALQAQIQYFIENAKFGNYISPNRVIAKSERSKWRFKVIRYYKALTSIPPEDMYFDHAIVLLEELYKVLAQGCNVYLFSNNDPFASIKVAQGEFYDQIAQRVFQKECSLNNIIEILDMAVCSGLSYDTIHLELEYILLQYINEHKVKLELEDYIKQEVRKLEANISNLKRKQSTYYLEDHVNELCNLLLFLGIKFKESDEALRYYFAHIKERNKEIILYRALDIIEIMEDSALWIYVYEGAVKKRILPRKELQVQYKKLLEEVQEEK